MAARKPMVQISILHENTELLKCIAERFSVEIIFSACKNNSELLITIYCYADNEKRKAMRVHARNNASAEMTIFLNLLKKPCSFWPLDFNFYAQALIGEERVEERKNFIDVICIHCRLLREDELIKFLNKVAETTTSPLFKKQLQAALQKNASEEATQASAVTETKLPALPGTATRYNASNINPDLANYIATYLSVTEIFNCFNKAFIELHTDQVVQLLCIFLLSKEKQKAMLLHAKQCMPSVYTLLNYWKRVAEQITAKPDSEKIIYLLTKIKKYIKIEPALAIEFEKIFTTVEPLPRPVTLPSIANGRSPAPRGIEKKSEAKLLESIKKMPPSLFSKPASPREVTIVQKFPTIYEGEEHEPTLGV